MDRRAESEAAREAEARQAQAGESVMRAIAHHIARLLGRHAARVLQPVRPKQSMAMYAELEHLDGYAALGWAIGCLAASYRLRGSLIAVGLVAARLCVAAAAGLFGAM